MLHTPAGFTPLIDPVPYAGTPLTFVFHKGKLLLRSFDSVASEAALPTDLASLGIPAERLHPVGIWQGRYVQAVWADSEALPDDTHGWHGLRTLFGSADHGFIGLAGRASQIADWARTHRFCGACATPMQRASGERAYKCEACGHTAYPQICPAMMVLIRDGDRVLLAKHTRSPPGLFTALAGFVEAGESIEEAVHREVYEEVGLRVHKLQYFSSQSWPFPNSLMVAFTAEYLDGTIRVDPAEIEEARWFGPSDAWPDTPHTISIASALIAANRPGRG
ncbi:NAD(+) diphosphatase [Pseudoduganella armeniaca]|uniref:NAD(+) diphosphatase n=1 Tax=Pseudoduganella armeniaca TaxID=2072590 RepID=A0A2R4C3V6_9BURK|nr:NAD(+) diphosphatase [Pseudoduganella armeniaca]AVR94296.1 NAD(+) diphosphatase [Pseudoduganella armeniaca]